jgi:phage terminase large subunit-like protein
LAATLDLVAPAHLWVPPHTSSAGDDAIELAESAGIILDPEQQLALRIMLAELPDGRWAAFEAAIIEARQNGKTVVLQVIALSDLFLFDARLIVWTAHLFSTTQEAFRDLDAIIAGTPAFSRRVKKVHRANGDEAFELLDGRRIVFRARSKTGGRGLTGDRVLLDEALFLTPTEMGSLLPTLSARPNPQVVYGASAGVIGSDVLRNVRDRGRAGGDPSLAYIEWCAPENACDQDKCDHRIGVEGCALDNVEMIRLANPALERRISLVNVQAERRSLTPEEFARERLGWWDEPAFGVSGIPADDWAACAQRDAAPTEPVCLALDVAPGHSSASIVTCGGALHVVEHRAGNSWVVERLLEIREAHTVTAIGLDPAGPVGALIPELETAGIELTLLDARQSMQACEGFLSGVLDRSLIHRDQLALNSAVAGAGRRQVGDSWKWSRRDSTVDISPLVAGTVARYLWTQAPPPPPVKVFVAFS